MALLLQDPRKFSNIFPDSNLLINQAQHDLANNENNQLICALIEDILKQQQDQLLSVAYNLAPSLEISNYIWDAFQQVISQNSTMHYFAIPVVFVVGSREQISLKNTFDNQQLLYLMQQNNFVINDCEIIVSDRLYDIESISKIKPSQLYQLTHADILLDHNLLAELNNPPIVNTGEGVHLRYILGYAKTGSLVFANYDKFSMGLMQILSDSLKDENATLYPIPFAPCNLSLATVNGNFHQQETHIMFTLGNQVKQLRLDGKEPEIRLSAQKSNIQIELWISNSNQAVDTLIWQMNPTQNFSSVCVLLENLFNDMRLPIKYYEEHHHD